MAGAGRDAGAGGGVALLQILQGPWQRHPQPLEYVLVSQKTRDGCLDMLRRGLRHELPAMVPDFRGVDEFSYYGAVLNDEFTARPVAQDLFFIGIRGRVDQVKFSAEIKVSVSIRASILLAHFVPMVVFRQRADAAVIFLQGLLNAGVKDSPPPLATNI